MTSPRPDADTSATGSEVSPEPTVRGDDSASRDAVAGAEHSASATSKMVIAACDAYRKWCNRLNYVGAMRRAVEAALDAAPASPAIAQPHRLEAPETRPDVEGLVEQARIRADEHRRLFGSAKDYELLEGLASALSAYEGRLQELTREGDEAARLLGQYAREAGEATGRLEMSEAAGMVDEWRKHAQAAEARASAAEKALESARTLLIKADSELSMIEGAVAGIGHDFGRFQSASKKLGSNAISLLNSVQDRVALGITPCAADARTAISSAITALEQKPEGGG